MNKLNRRILKFSIAIWIIVLILAVVGFVYLANNKEISLFDFYDNTSYSELQTVKDEIISEDITDISVDWITGGIKIFKTEKDRIHIIQKAPEKFDNNKLLSLNVNDSRLEIKDENKNRIWIGFNVPKKSYLELYLPEKIYNNIDISNVSNKFECEFIKSKNLIVNSVSGSVSIVGEINNSTFETVSGEVDCENLISEKLKAKTISGDVNISGSFDNADLETISGNVTVSSNKMINDLQANSVSGNTKVYIPDNDGFVVNLHKVSGQLNSDFETTKNGNTYKYKNGDSKFDVEVVSGDIYILKK